MRLPSEDFGWKFRNFIQVFNQLFVNELSHLQRHAGVVGGPRHLDSTSGMLENVVGGPRHRNPQIFVRAAADWMTPAENGRLDDFDI